MSYVEPCFITTKTVYKVMSNTDLEEGRGKPYVLAMYLDYEEAAKHAKGNYVMGSDCPIRNETLDVVQNGDDPTFYVLGPKIETKYHNPRLLRAQALAKLTEEEKKVLGLND